MQICISFDGGNIACLSAATPGDIRLAINKDNNSDFYQWFHYRLTGARGQDCVMRLTNAGGAAYADGWHGYRAVASYDRSRCFPVPTHYPAPTLTIRHPPATYPAH